MMRGFYVFLIVGMLTNSVWPQTFHFGASIDPFFNFKSKQVTVDFDDILQYGSNPTVDVSPIQNGASVEQNIIDNLDFLLERGFTNAQIFSLEGFGEYYIDVPILRDAVLEGFDYDSQYVDPTDPDSDLVDGLNEMTAKQRFRLIADIVPFFASEANKRGMDIDINIESLGHIINRASGEGIGSGDELVIAGNLPPLSPEQIATYIEQIKDAVTAYDPNVTTFTISEEAFSDEYVRVISETTARLGLRHQHTGPSSQGYGDSWSAYYYSFYPLSPLQEIIYRFLIVLAATPAVEATTIGAARAAGKDALITVGHYTPWPASLGSSIEDLYLEDRIDPDFGPLPISSNNPTDRQGNPVATRTSGLQRNYIVYGAIAEGIQNFFFSVDLEPAIEALLQMDLNADLIPRLNAFAFALDESKPICNVIIDEPQPLGGDLADFEEYFDTTYQFSMAEPIFAAIASSGFEPWVTYNHPLERDGIDAYWIVTSGGGEWIDEEGSSESPPLWVSADPLSDDLWSVIDPSQNDKPVMISVMAGLPNQGNWDRVRALYGIPLGRGGTETGLRYASSNLVQYPENQTSIATNILSNNEGELFEDDLGGYRTADLFPETLDWNGQPVRFRGLDPAQFGHMINVIAPDEVPSQNIVLASTQDDSSESIRINDPDETGDNLTTTALPVVYIMKNGLDGKKVLINPNIYHFDFSYVLSDILCDVSGVNPRLNHPATAYIATGQTTVAFAIEDTILDLQLPIASNQVVVDRFDEAGEWVIDGQRRDVNGLFPYELKRHELVVFSDPSKRSAKVDAWMNW